MILFSAIFILFSHQAHAEYRAFLLQISNAEGTENRQILSTLDPDQYPGYHPLKQGERIVYVGTWMCRGRTSEQAICPNPRQLEPAVIPDSP